MICVKNYFLYTPWQQNLTNSTTSFLSIFFIFYWNYVIKYLNYIKEDSLTNIMLVYRFIYLIIKIIKKITTLTSAPLLNNKIICSCFHKKYGTQVWVKQKRQMLLSWLTLEDLENQVFEIPFLLPDTKSIIFFRKKNTLPKVLHGIWFLLEQKKLYRILAPV